MLMLEVTIERSRWLHGQGHQASGLLRDGKLCCLGFLCLALGVPEQKLAGKLMPWACESALPAWLLDEDSYQLTDVRRAASINDDVDLDLFDPEREAKITELFARHDVRAVFVG